MRQALQKSPVARSSTLIQLAHALVSTPEPRCLIFSADPPDADQTAFLASLSRSFAVLPVCVLSAEPLPGLPAAYVRLDPRTPEARLTAELKRFLAQAAQGERRALPRFDWPLRASLALPGGGPLACNLRALSASGGFLECAGPYPDPGAAGRLQVLFQNFGFSTDCEVLDRRQASSNLPDGFAVRFVGLSAEAQAKLDRIVRDALVRSLLEPEAPPEVPSLGGEELLPGGFQIL